MHSLMARFVNDHAKREQGWVLRPKRKLECVGADLRQEHIGQVDKQAAAPPLSREPDGFVVCMPFALWRSKCEDWVEVLVATLAAAKVSCHRPPNAHSSPRRITQLKTCIDTSRFALNRLIRVQEDRRVRTVEHGYEHRGLDADV